MACYGCYGVRGGAWCGGGIRLNDKNKQKDASSGWSMVWWWHRFSVSGVKERAKNYSQIFHSFDFSRVFGG